MDWETFVTSARKIEKDNHVYYFHCRTSKIFHLFLEQILITHAVCHGIFGLLFVILALCLTYRTIDSELNEIPEENRTEILKWINNHPITADIVVNVIEKWRN